MTQADGDSRDLFVDDDPTTVIEVPDTLDRRVRWFLDRWCDGWQQQPVIEAELMQLIAWAISKHRP